MKKQIVVSSIIAAAILGGTVILSVAKAEGPKSTEPQLLAADSLIAPKSPIIASASKTETVYVMSDGNGNVNSKFIGSTLYSGTEELPFSMNATYYLDGAEISPKDLAGKSGHVKIIFNYSSTAKKNGSFIPFIALTTLNLDHQKFTNIRLKNGKIFNENDTTYTLIGYGITGLNRNLGTSFLPDQFVFEADTTNFNMADTYTIFTSDILADVDLSELSRIDQLTSSIYQLQDAMNKLVDGATDLSTGLGQALDGTKTLYDGSKTLAEKTKEAATGASKLSEGTTELKNGLTTLTSFNAKLQTGSTAVITKTLQKLNTDANIQAFLVMLHYPEGTKIDTNNYVTILPEIIALIKNMGGDPKDVEESYGLLELTTGVIGYTNGVANAATGADTLATSTQQLSAGLTQLADGTTTLSNGLGTLVDGQNKLYQGSITLKDGLITFKTSGIDKLVNFASKDLASFTRNLRSSITAASSYKSFGGVDAKSVKFIVKTPAI